MLKYEAVWRSPRDMDLASMDGAVVRRADAELIVRVRSALGARLNVVHVDVDGISAAGHLTRLPVAQQHLLAHGGRHRLGGAGRRALAPVGHVDGLRVTARGVEGRGVDRDEVGAGADGRVRFEREMMTVIDVEDGIEWSLALSPNAPVPELESALGISGVDLGAGTHGQAIFVQQLTRDGTGVSGDLNVNSTSERAGRGQPLSVLVLWLRVLDPLIVAGSG
jgi:hypothetical protein